MEYDIGASAGFVSIEAENEDGVKVIQLPFRGDDLDTLESAVEIARQYENE